MLLNNKLKSTCSAALCEFIVAEIEDDGSDCDGLVEDAYAYLVSKTYPKCATESKKGLSEERLQG